MAAARLLSRQRASTAALEQDLDQLLSGADQAMVDAFTGGFRVAQTKLAIAKVLAEPLASAALESAQVVALGILVREQMDPARFGALYRPFATVLPGPGYELPPAIDRQIATFMQKLPTISGDAKAEVTTVARVLTEPPKPAPASASAATAAAPLGTPPVDHGVPGLYAAAWKLAIDTAHSSGRTISFRAAQDLAEQAAPHDGSGIVGTAGVAAGGIFMRDLLPIEKVLLLYEPFAVAFPYESLR